LGLWLWTTSRLNPENLAAFATSGVFVGGVGAVSGLVSLAVIYAMVTRLRKQPFRATIGLTRSRFTWLAVLGALLLGGVMDVLTLALHKPLVPDVLRPAFTGMVNVAVMSVFAVVITPLAEELIFRGMLYPVAARSLGAAGSLVFVSLLFGVVHVATYGWDVYLVAQTGLAGLYLTWLRMRTGSLVPSVAAHATFNLYATMEAIVVLNLLK